MRPDEKSLEEAVEYSKVPSLPEVWNGKDVWFKAIAKVVKENTRVEYVVYYRNIKYKVVDKEIVVTDELNVLKDTGSMSRISKVIEFYPFIFLQDTFLPKFKKREDVVNFIKKESGLFNVDMINRMSDENIKSLTYKIAYKNQLLKDNI